MDTSSLSFLFSLIIWNFFCYIGYIIFIPIVLFSSFVCLFSLFPGDEDVAIWEMGRWSSVIGSSCDHVVSRQSHLL